MFRRYLLLLILPSLLSCSGLDFPQAVIPAHPDAGDWPDTGAAILQDVATLEFRVLPTTSNRGAKLIAVLDHRRRMKVLTSDGFKYADIELGVDGFSTVTKVAARSVHPDGTIVELDEDEIRTTVFDVRGRKVTQLKKIRFSIPEPKVGGLIEYRYERVYTHPDLLPAWIFGNELPVERAEFNVVSPDSISIDHRFGRGENIERKLPMRRRLEDGRKRLVFVETKIPAVYPEPGMPHISRIAPWLALSVTKADEGKEKRRLSSWLDVTQRLQGLLARSGKNPLQGSPLTRFRQVRDALRPVPFYGVGVLRPVPAAGVLRGEPTCSRDALGTLESAFKGSSAKYFPAFVTSLAGPPPVEDFPSLYPFLRAVLALDITTEVASDPTCKDDPLHAGLLCSVPEGSYAFADAICSNCRYGELPNALTGGRALVLFPRGPRWIDVPEDPAHRNRSMTQFGYSMDVDGSLTGMLQIEAEGERGRRLRNRLLGKGVKNSWESVVSDVTFGKNAKTKVSSTLITNLETAEEPVKVRTSVSTMLGREDYEVYSLLPGREFGYSMPGPWRSTRRHDRILKGPRWEDTSASIMLPVGYVAEFPSEVTEIVTDFAEYAGGFGKRNRNLVFSRRLVIKKRVIKADMWPAFREFIDKVSDFENTAIIIRSPSNEVNK